MKAEIITIGDEILIGQIINSNSSWIANKLVNNGIDCVRITTVGDSAHRIKNAVEAALVDVDLIILTGGLGPTSDDITKKTLCSIFEDQLVLNKEVLSDITEFFKSKKRSEILNINKDQALVPSKAKIIRNKMGTAPALWFFKNQANILAFPGVPYEMKSLFELFLNDFTNNYKLEKIVNKTVLIRDIPESQIADKIKGWESALNKKIKLAYLPKPGVVRLRLTTAGSNEEQLNSLIRNELDKLRKYIQFYEDDINLNQLLHNLFSEKQFSLSVAESCTSGLLASELTLIPGSSKYFKGGVIAYSDKIKSTILDVNNDLIFKKTSVSKETAFEMAKNVAEKFESDFSLATTGYAGPKTINKNIPVGTVFIAIKNLENIYVEEFLFSGNREMILEQAKNKAFELLIKEIKKIK